MENEYDVHFNISGFFSITAKTREEAREKTNDIINARIDLLEEVLLTGLKDENYATDVELTAGEEEFVDVSGDDFVDATSDEPVDLTIQEEEEVTIDVSEAKDWVTAPTIHPNDAEEFLKKLPF